MLTDWILPYLADKLELVHGLAAALLAVLGIAVAYLLATRGFRRRRLRAILRLLFHAKVWRSRSARLDYAYMLLNIFVFPVLIGLFILGYREVAAPFLPAHGRPYLSETACRVITTLVLYLAYEFAYWVDHYLSHKVPLLWEFHKVHHTATVMTPLTVYRVHPIDSLFFYNIKAIITGAGYVLAVWSLGREVALAPENIVIVVYMLLYGHLQHSHLWIAFPGHWGKVFFSPAHHQIHHSKASVHHNRNFGASLAIFDWLFGPLTVPTKERQALEFGVSRDDHGHRLHASLAQPMRRAYRRFVPKRNVGAAADRAPY